MFYKQFIYIALWLIMLFPLPIQAQDTDIRAKIRLLPEVGQIAAEQTIWVGIEQSIAPGWHTYWVNPGDSGAEPRINWNLPAGFRVSKIYWPTPHKLPYGPLLNYGYEDHVILLQKLTAPANLPPGPLTFSADVEILVCKEECIPEFSAHQITFNDPNNINENNESYIEAALSALPIKTDQSVFFNEDGGEFLVSVTLPKGKEYSAEALASMKFFPRDWGLVSNAASPKSEIFEDKALILRQARGERNVNALDSMRGVIAYEENGVRKAFSFTAQNMNNWLKIAKSSLGDVKKSETSFLAAFFFALLGGMILNLMPCVFPVLSIKALSLVKIAEKHPEIARTHGLAYTAGVVFSFLGIAALLLILKAGGAGIGWGFQLQNPVVVSLLTYLLFLVGLNLSGYFEIGGAFGNVGQKLTQGDGLSSSFFTGVLATLVATPCTAPFMALAIGYALTQTAIINLTVFAALGFGLALPYLALSFSPKLRNILPKPGPWMESFRKVLAIPMYVSVLWLLWVLSQQTTILGVGGVIIGMAAIIFGLWLLKKSDARTALKLLSAMAFLIPIAVLPSRHSMPISEKSLEFGKTYSAEKLDALLAGSDPVFVEMTAAWCITCKVNYVVAINTETTRNTFAQYNVHYLVGDWTNYDPEITKYLNQYERDGVPIYVYYGPPDEAGQRSAPHVLPQILTPNSVKNIIERSITF